MEVFFFYQHDAWEMNHRQEIKQLKRKQLFVSKSKGFIDWLMQERRNSCVLAMELHLSCINPQRWSKYKVVFFGYTIQLISSRMYVTHSGLVTPYIDTDLGLCLMV